VTAMSFDIFVIKFKNKEALRFKRASFEDIFGHHAIKREQGFMRIVYPDKGGADIYVQDGEEIGSVMFNHCGGEMFWQDLYEFMKRAELALYWFDLPPCCAIPSEAMMADLSFEFLESVHTPSVVHNGKEVTEAFGRSGES
jgi:hypothetical protein